MKNLWFVAAVMIMPIGPAKAVDMPSTRLAQELGDILASEALCGLKYDRAAIQDFINARVPADDSEFTNSLKMMTAAAQFQLGQMASSEKAPHCAQTQSLADFYKFISR